MRQTEQDSQIFFNKEISDVDIIVSNNMKERKKKKIHLSSSSDDEGHIEEKKEETVSVPRVTLENVSKSSRKLNFKLAI